MKTSGNVQSWLSIRARENPDAPAIITGTSELTFRRLYDKAQRLAASLSEQGVTAGSHVALVSHNSKKYVLLIHALMLLRAVIVPINIRLTDEEISKQIAFADCSHVFAGDKIDKLNAGKNHPSKDTILLMFTSGTSGDPKCVELTYENVFYSAVGTKLRLQITGQDSWLLSLPLYHIGGFSIIIRSVIFGIPVVIPSSLDVVDIIAAIGDYNPTVLSLVPTMMKRLIEHGAQPGDSHKAVLLGGGPVPESLLERCTGSGWKIAATYGSTETSSQIATRNPIDSKNPGSAGQQMPFNRIRVIDPAGNEVSPGTEGEITVQSPSLMKGYYKRRDLTDTVIRDEWYYTGDYGYCTGDNYLYVVSRRSDLIVSGGENVNPLEVEEVLRGHSAIRDVCVFPYADIEWGEVVAAVVVTGDDDLTTDVITGFLAGKLSSYKIPKKIFFTESLPYSEHGKLNRSAIRKAFGRIERF